MPSSVSCDSGVCSIATVAGTLSEAGANECAEYQQDSSFAKETRNDIQ
jgi:hypothetical protein